MATLGTPQGRAANRRSEITIQESPRSQRQMPTGQKGNVGEI
jgi:hypothetical protein